MYRQLTREQRYAIYPGKQEGKTQSAIARQIGVNRSTVSREIRRNSNRHGRYWWSIAHADGRRFGDWEMDTIVGKGQKSAILTLCERSRNYLIMERLPHGMDHGKVADAVIRLLYPYRKNVLTITSDTCSSSSPSS